MFHRQNAESASRPGRSREREALGFVRRGGGSGRELVVAWPELLHPRPNPPLNSEHGVEQLGAQYVPDLLRDSYRVRNLSHHMTFPQSAHTWVGGGSPGGEYRASGGCQSWSPASHSVPNK
jgi:hypothetical protein